jgi:elongation factor G
MLERLKNRYKVEVDQFAPKIPYQETITKKATARYRHKKQTGGRGQFAEVHLRLEPMPLDSEEDYEFINEIRSAAIPGQYIPAVEKGVKNTMKEGVIAGCRVVKVRVAVYDGKHHEVDSSEAAFMVATRNAFRDAFKLAKPVLLEPIVEMAITVPSTMVGDIMGDLSRRRGRIIAQDSMGPFQVVRAKVPLAEIREYATELTSITGDEGSFTAEFSHYDSVPGNIQQEIVAKYEASRTKEED